VVELRDDVYAEVGEVRCGLTLEDGSDLEKLASRYDKREVYDSSDMSY
jgi:hypothetical protein